MISYSKQISFFITFYIIACLTGCSFFFTPLHGRENGDDPQAQIYNLFARQTGVQKVTVSFNWRGTFFNYDEKERIEEAVLVYNIGEALPVRSIPLPPDSGGTVGFDYKDRQYTYSKVLEGLSEGDTVWFALYPRTMKRWLAPLYETVTVRDPLSLPVLGPLIKPVLRGYTADTLGAAGELETGFNYPLFNDGFMESYLILTFDLPKRIHCTQALLSLPTSIPDIAHAYPVVFEYVENIDGNSLLKLIDESVSNSFPLDNSPGGAGGGTADITDVVNGAILHETDTIAVRVGPGTNTNPNFGTEEIQITFIEY